MILLLPVALTLEMVPIVQVKPPGVIDTSKTCAAEADAH